MYPKECTFTFNEQQRARFSSGELVAKWRVQYPEILDEDDARILSGEWQRRYHFCEFLSAVLIHEATGYLSMVEKYATKSHTLKLAQLAQYLPPAIFDWVCANQSGQPDLFIFDPVSRNWCFREVKGPRDQKRPAQIDWAMRFERLLRDHALDPSEKLGTIWLTRCH